MQVPSLLFITINQAPAESWAHYRPSEKTNLSRYLIPGDQLREKKRSEIIFFRSVPNRFQHPSKEHGYRLGVKSRSGRKGMYGSISHLGTSLGGSEPLVHSIIFLAQCFGELKSCFTITYYVQVMLPLRKWQIRTFLPFIF